MTEWQSFADQPASDRFEGCFRLIWLIILCGVAEMLQAPVFDDLPLYIFSFWRDDLAGHCQSKLGGHENDFDPWRTSSAADWDHRLVLRGNRISDQGRVDCDCVLEGICEGKHVGFCHGQRQIDHTASGDVVALRQQIQVHKGLQF
jgi:hypothetical protein